MTELADRLLAEYHAGQGEHHYVVCAQCGAPSWRFSKHDAEPRIVLQEYSGGCARCEEVNRRAPEVYLWVLDVVEKATRED